MNARFGWFRRFLNGGYIDQSACQHAFDRMHTQDQIGDRIHLIFACAGIILLLGPVTITELAMAPLLVFFFVRVLNTSKVWIHGLGQPIVLVTLALAGWMGISLLWSGNPSHGASEIGELRWFVLVALVFPVIEHRAALIRAMMIGILIGQTAQVLDLFDGFGIDPISKLVENHPGRVGGWWHPVVGADLLVMGMGLHGPKAFFRIPDSNRGWVSNLHERKWNILGFIFCGLGVLATGSRGAWIAAGLLIFTLGFISMIRSWVRVRTTCVVLIGVIFVLTIGAIGLREQLTNRIEETKIEIRAIFDGDLDSYTGQRVRMGRIAIDAIQEHPFIGVGAGGYQAWGNAHEIQRDRDQSSLDTYSTENEYVPGVFAHAHNGAIQVWSTLGLIGMILWILMIMIMLNNAYRWARMDRDGFKIHPAQLGPLFAIIGLLLASITDVIQINTQSAAILGLLGAISPTLSPGHPLWNEQSEEKTS